VNITDCGDGTYQGTYRAPIAGVYELHVTMHGEAVSGSPFDVQVIALDGHGLPLTCRALQLIAIDCD
jgi:hypothetical protein